MPKATPRPDADYDRIGLLVALDVMQWDGDPEHGRRALDRAREIAEHAWNSRQREDGSGPRGR